MKKIISVLLIIALCLPGMSVMAAECSISNGGLTLEIPGGYSSYTQEDASAASADKYGGIVDVLGALFDWGTLAQVAGDVVVGIASDVAAEADYADNLELVICDDNMQRYFKIYVENNYSYTLDDLSYYDFRDAYVPIWINMLANEGYSADSSDAVMCMTQNGIPYIQLDGYSSSNGCCRMAVIMYNGYYDRVVFIITNETTLSESSVMLFDNLLNSISVSVSPYYEGPLTGESKYSSVLIDRAELTD